MSKHHHTTGASLPSFDAEVAAAIAALEKHHASVTEAKDQMQTLPDAFLQPCCDVLGGTTEWAADMKRDGDDKGAGGAGSVVAKAECKCDTFVEGTVYP